MTAADLQADAIATVTLCALSLGAVYSLSRLFASGSYVGPVVTMVIVMHAVAWGCRRQGLRPASAAIVSVASLVLLLAWLVMPETTRYGLPLTATLRAAHQALGDAGTDFHAVIAPAPVTRGFLFITVAAVGVIALVADWAAFRMRATVEAVVPSFTLFVFAAALGGHRHRNASVALEVAALLAFVVVHQVTVNQEGSAWFASRTRGALSYSAQVGAVLGGVAVLAGLIVGPALPGAGSRAVILWRGADRAGAGGTRTIPSPLVDLRTRLLDYANVEVFTVKSTTPEYWRLTSLDAFNGVEWSSDNSYNTVGHHLPHASTPAPGQRIEQDFAITGPISSIWLPAAYEPDSISGVPGVSYNSDSGSLISEHDTTEGLSYHVSSVITTGQLDPQKLETAGAVPSGSIQRYTKLPQLPQTVIDLAREVVSGKATEYDKAKALQDFFRSPIFTYDDTITSGDGNDALEQFLFTTRRGYCQQFAGAYAVMARVLGLPTRVAVGFSYGVQDGAGVWHVKDSFAHAWPEVYFPDFGWVPFEPTPGRGIPGAQQYTGQAQAEQGQAPATSATSTPGPKAQSRTTPSTAFRLPKGERDLTAGGTTAKTKGTSSTITLFAWLGGLALAVALWVAAIGGTWWFRRSWRRAVLLLPGHSGVGRARWGPRWMRRVHRGPPGSIEPAVPVLVAWIDVSEMLAWWGATRHPDETYLEFAHRVSHQLRLALAVDRDASAALLGLAKDATAAEYAPAVLTAEAAGRAATALESIERALVGAADFRHRMRLVLDPRLVFGQAALRRTRAARVAQASQSPGSATAIPVEAV